MVARGSSGRSLIKRVEKLEIKDGDVVVVYSGQNGLSSLSHIQREVDRLHDFLARQGRKGVLILVVGKDVDLRTLDPEDMRRLGWIRLHA